jgi:cytochrome c oxidase subunit 4
MSARVLHVLMAWAVLLVLLALELGASYLPIGRSMRPLLLVLAVLMAGVIVTVFMEMSRGPDAIRLFAVAGLLWLVILLALGSLDPLTRIDYDAQGSDTSAITRKAPQHETQPEN